MSFALITTTINVPKLLDAYLANASTNSITDLTVIVIGDKKTPPEAAEFCAELGKKYPYTVEYYNPENQEIYLNRFPALREHLQWNSIQRRNIGLLRAYEIGADIIVTIDDDNFVVEPNYFECYANLGATTTLPAVTASNGWFNVCTDLQDEHGGRFYHRGYPVSLRGQEASVTYLWNESTGRVMVTAGLWLEDPDLDAVQRLASPIRAISYKREGNFALEHNTWSPFNSQNTALHREVIPAYFLSPYIGRYDDIWASYIVKRIADHLGHYISYGNPLVRQDRNPHNYFKDFDKERIGMEMTERVCTKLREIKLTGSNYHECFKEIIVASAEWMSDPTWTEGERAYLDFWFSGCSIWHETFAALTK